MVNALYNETLEEYISLKLEAGEEIRRAIVKGAFLGSGSITDPQKQYHLEIVFEEKSNAEYIQNICKEYSIHLKILESKNKYYYVGNYSHH